MTTPDDDWDRFAGLAKLDESARILVGECRLLGERNDGIRLASLTRDGRWSFEHLLGEASDRRAAELLAELPALALSAPVAQLICGQPNEVIVSLFDGGTVEVAELEVVWLGHDPRIARRDQGRVIIEGSHDATDRHDRISAAIRSLGTRRRRRFRRCSMCDDMIAPEHWHGQGVCQGCAERHLGVVH